MGRRIARDFLQILARLAAWPLALLILFEEWGWDPLQRALVRLAQALGLEWIEARIRGLPPYGALALFLLPSALLLPIKLLALALISRGQVMLGAAVIVLAKLAGTAVVARLFTLTRSALMQLAWFARTYTAWARWKEQLLAQVRQSWPWRWGRAIKRQWQRRWRAWRQGPT